MVWAAACAILVAGFLEMPRVVHVATSGLLAGVPWLYATVGWRHGLRLRHHSGHGHRLLASLIALVLIVAFLRTVLALSDSVIAMLQAPPPEGAP